MNYFMDDLTTAWCPRQRILSNRPGRRSDGVTKILDLKLAYPTNASLGPDVG